jgi:hypothetical protein
MRKESSVLLDTIQLGEPAEHRGIVVTPLFPRRDPVAFYLTLEEALPLGLRISETSQAGNVPELQVENPLAENVLLYDGEELVGAKQNRILNVTVLVAARSRLPIPVSCVEEGRWAYRSPGFDAARHIAHSELRRRKAETLASQPLARGIAQGEVWDEVREKASRMRVSSPTGAAADIHRAHAFDIGRLEREFPAQPGQCGALLSLGDTHCLDLVSRPDAFARLYPKLRAGYLLDALERLDDEPAPPEQVERFLASASASLHTRGPSAGLGQDLRLRGEGVIGSGLELDGELIQLSAFTSHGGTRLGRIARPSRRR